jgi:hypothetical protein
VGSVAGQVRTAATRGGLGAWLVLVWGSVLTGRWHTTVVVLAATLSLVAAYLVVAGWWVRVCRRRDERRRAHRLYARGAALRAGRGARLVAVDSASWYTMLGAAWGDPPPPEDAEVRL